MKRAPSPCQWRHYPQEAILPRVSWYCRYQLSYRDPEGMTRERGLSADHTTVWLRGRK